jgi:2-haloalkanoic acid dehalogenase type II
MRLTDFKALSFGCYGTLVDRASGLYAALQPLLSAGHISLPRDQVLGAFVRHEVAQQAETPAMIYSRVLVEAHRRLAREWGVLLSDESHALFGHSVAHWPIFADAPPALQYLKRFFKLAVLSNVDQESFAGTARRLEVRFDAVFTAEEIGSYKPDPRNFEYLIDRLAKAGVARGEILHVASSLPRDQEPAASCGIAFAWIDRPPRQEGGSQARIPRSRGANSDFRYANMVDMVKAHQKELFA